MAHFARLENDTVQEVIVVDNDNAPGDFPDSESAGIAYLASIGVTGDFRQTSYNNNFRGMYAGMGYLYNPDTGDFSPPPPINQEVIEP